MNRYTILVVEDDKPVRSLITTTLKIKDYKYLTATSGSEALLSLVSWHPDIMLLDLGLPDMDGTDIIRNVREWSEMPIIVISARTDASDKIQALDAGADDYLTKPFSIEELLARIRVMERRISASVIESGNVFVNGPLKIDYAAGSVTMDGEELHLTAIEYRLLCILAKNVDKVLTHTFIMGEIWGHSRQNDIASLRVYMGALRKKIDCKTDEREFIQTHIGIGYRMLRVNRT